ncbi:MAG: nuclear transport factor 2 family protein [Sphingomonadales bacterium]
MTDVYEKDRTALRSLIEKLFADLSWTSSNAPDWAAFRAAFRDDAVLYPSARPLTQTPIGDFIERMENERTSGNLQSIVEAAIAHDVTVFGNTALVYTSYEACINGGTPGRGANAFLFVRDGGTWKVGAMAWDNASEATPLPEKLNA